RDIDLVRGRLAWCPRSRIRLLRSSGGTTGFSCTRLAASMWITPRSVVSIDKVASLRPPAGLLALTSLAHSRYTATAASWSGLPATSSYRRQGCGLRPAPDPTAVRPDRPGPPYTPSRHARRGAARLGGPAYHRPRQRGTAACMTTATADIGASTSAHVSTGMARR